MDFGKVENIDEVAQIINLCRKKYILVIWLFQLKLRNLI